MTAGAQQPHRASRASPRTHLRFVTTYSGRCSVAAGHLPSVERRQAAGLYRHNNPPPCIIEVPGSSRWSQGNSCVGRAHELRLAELLGPNRSRTGPVLKLRRARPLLTCHSATASGIGAGARSAGRSCAFDFRVSPWWQDALLDVKAAPFLAIMQAAPAIAEVRN